MELLNSVLLSIHVIAGFSSLALFLVPIFTKKGGRSHIIIGKIYIAFMWVVVVTAFLLSVINFIEQNYFTAAFLGYLSILTSHPLWYGIAVLKYRHDHPKAIILKRRILESIIMMLALVNIAVFIYLQGKGQSILLLIFGILGLFAGSGVFQRKEKLIEGIDRIKDHISSMMISGIAAYTAFFAFGGHTFFGSFYEGSLVALFWTMPGVIGGIIIAYYQRKYTPGSTGA